MLATNKSAQATLKKFDDYFLIKLTGKPRVKSDLTILGDLRDFLRDAQDDLSRNSHVEPLDEEMLREFEKRYTRLDKETQMVQLALELGAEFLEFSRLASSANFAFDRYTRHFAAQSRDTRDYRLLEEILTDIKLLHDEMGKVSGGKLHPALADDRAQVAANLEKYRPELPKIQAAFKEGDLEEQGNRLAYLANQQFALYQTFFAGQPRVSRRPAFLERILSTLQDHLSAMLALKEAGLANNQNDTNITIVQQRITAYQNELTEIVKLRGTLTTEELMGVLGGAANELFQVYRDNYANKERLSVSLEELGHLIDKLDEIRRQMEALGRIKTVDTNIRNGDVVREHQTIWVAEYHTVRAEQRAQAIERAQQAV